MARECTYFDRERIQIEKAFRKPRSYAWEEIRRIDGGFDSKVNLYLADGTKVFTADISMVNFETFCQMVKVQCPEAVKGYYQSQAYDRPQKRRSSFPELFAVWFAPVFGVVSLIGLFVLCNTKIRYSEEKMTVKFPLRREKSILEKYPAG